MFVHIHIYVVNIHKYVYMYSWIYVSIYKTGALLIKEYHYLEDYISFLVDAHSEVFIFSQTLNFLQSDHKKTSLIYEPLIIYPSTNQKKFLDTWKYVPKIMMIYNNVPFTVTVKKISMATLIFFMHKFISTLQNHKWCWNDAHRMKIADVTCLQNRPS